MLSSLQFPFKLPLEESHSAQAHLVQAELDPRRRKKLSRQALKLLVPLASPRQAAQLVDPRLSQANRGALLARKVPRPGIPLQEQPQGRKVQRLQEKVVNKGHLAQLNHIPVLRHQVEHRHLAVEIQPRPLPLLALATRLPALKLVRKLRVRLPRAPPPHRKHLLLPMRLTAL